MYRVWKEEVRGSWVVTVRSIEDFAFIGRLLLFGYGSRGTGRRNG